MSYSPERLPGEPTIYAPYGFKDEEHYHQCVRGRIMEATADVRSLEKLLLPVESVFCPQCGRDVKYRKGYCLHVCSNKMLMATNGEWHTVGYASPDGGAMPAAATKEGE